MENINRLYKFVTIKLNQMAKLNNLFNYQDKVFDKFLNSLFPITDKEEDKEEKKPKKKFQTQSKASDIFSKIKLSSRQNHF